MLRRFLPIISKFWKILVVVILSLFLIWVILQGYSLTWTGFGDFAKPDGDFVRGKTLWDWMQLFIIPIFLSLGAFYLNRSERESERQRAEKRSSLEREISLDHQQEAALQSYLDRMADLLLKEKLRKSKNEEVRDVARIRTLTVLRGLDARRKRLVLMFLLESGLIAKDRIINLDGADLTKADLRGAALTEANVSGAILNHADLRDAYLSGADLSRAHLIAAKLDGAMLSDACLLEADLSGASLSNAFMAGAVLTGAFLNEVDLSGADLSEVRLSETYLEKVNLSDAVLVGTDLAGVDLSDVDLTNADLTNADLSRADLSGAKVSTLQLEKARSLKRAIMPDGTIHK